MQRIRNRIFKYRGKRVYILGDVKIESCHTTKGLCETNEYTVTFQDEGEISPLHPLLIQNGTEFGCDIDGNGEIDFYIQFLQSDSSKFLYLNANKEPLQECEIKKEGTMNQWDLSVVKMFDNPSITQNTRGEGWGGVFLKENGVSNRYYNGCSC